MVRLDSYTAVFADSKEACIIPRVCDVVTAESVLNVATTSPAASPLAYTWSA